VALLMYSHGHARPASLLAGEEKILASNQLQIQIRIPPKGLKPVESLFLGAFLGAAKFWAQIFDLLPPCTANLVYLALAQASRAFIAASETDL
jgi:hypothetical protein